VLIRCGERFRIMPAKRAIAEPEHKELKGWADIAAYLGQPVATAQRWAKTGMPVHRSGRYVVSDTEELSRWLGRESGMGAPAHVTHTGEPDLVAELKRGLTAARKQHKPKKRR
jgi:hypothetical protein